MRNAMIESLSLFMHESFTFGNERKHELFTLLQHMHQAEDIDALMALREKCEGVPDR